MTPGPPHAPAGSSGAAGATPDDQGAAGTGAPAADDCLVIGPPGARHQGLLLHGYGGCKEEVAGLAASLSEALGLRLAVPDLPGHGARRGEPLTLAAARAAVAAAQTRLADPCFVVGYSMGGRLGLLCGLPAVAALSLPGAAVFPGSPRELVRTLRPRNVTEAEPFAGLRDVLAAPVQPAPGMLLLRAADEIASAADLAAEWRARGVHVEVVPGTDHVSIVAAPATAALVAGWLALALP